MEPAVLRRAEVTDMRKILVVLGAVGLLVALRSAPADAHGFAVGFGFGVGGPYCGAPVYAPPVYVAPPAYYPPAYYYPPPGYRYRPYYPYGGYFLGRGDSIRGYTLGGR